MLRRSFLRGLVILPAAISTKAFWDIGARPAFTAPPNRFVGVSLDDLISNIDPSETPFLAHLGNTTVKSKLEDWAWIDPLNRQKIRDNQTEFERMVLDFTHGQSL